jgi:spore maturation protein CgeB
MSDRFQFRIFAHSWVSDWNHGNAHFLRGLARDLGRLGHEVRCYEELGSWSLSNLVSSESERAIDSIDQFRAKFPMLDIRFYDRNQHFEKFLDEQLRDADFVIIHEWNDPAIAASILSRKDKYKFRALFHDTHHRAYSRAGEILRFPLHLFDGVLAFGDPITRIYRDGFGIPQVWTFHEAADIENFHPIAHEKTTDVVWVGNWGDEERTKELLEFLVEPAAALRDRRFKVHGVRYPEQALKTLEAVGIEYDGYLPNLCAPETFARSCLTIHVPRREYANGLSGIPTIRVFEALACGIPLVCAPWTDAEHMFHPGEDYLLVPDGEAMAKTLERLLTDDAEREQLAQNGMRTIRARHTTAHRAEQLDQICKEMPR